MYITLETIVLLEEITKLKVVIFLNNIGLFFGSTTGNTERVADIVNENFDNKLFTEEIDINSIDKIKELDNIIFGISTWNIGELEFSWEEFFPNRDMIEVAVFQPKPYHLHLGPFAAVDHKLPPFMIDDLAGRIMPGGWNC